MENAEHKIRVMIVDDSLIVRGLMQRALKDDPEITVVATAPNGRVALEAIGRTPADIIILDVEMPEMDGLTALPELLKRSPKSRVIMASTLTLRNAEISLKALQLGASDYVPKPTAEKSGDVEEFYRQLIQKIKALSPRRAGGSPALGGGAAAAVRSAKDPDIKAQAVAQAQSRFAAALPILSCPMGAIVPAANPQAGLMGVTRAEAIAIASSTGGPQALLHVFAGLKGKIGTTPIFITQHMPPNFTTILADHISKACGADCHEAIDGEVVRAGVIYLAPGDFHMVVERQGNTIRLGVNKDPQENFCRPAADPMLRSLSKAYGAKLTVAVLTGMGSDGARGASEVVAAGGSVIAQDEASSVVYGMPKAVADAKLVKAVLPLDMIHLYLAKAMGV